MHKLSMSHTNNKRFLKLKQKLIFYPFTCITLITLQKMECLLWMNYQIAPILHQDVNPPCD